MHGPRVRARLIALACTRPPETAAGLGRTRWTHAELAAQVGMSESQAHEILRPAEIEPHLLEQWVMSERGPDFDVKAAVVCGLYLDPPEGNTRRLDRREDRHPGEGADTAGRGSAARQAGAARVRVQQQRPPKNLFAAAAGAHRRGQCDAFQDTGIDPVLLTPGIQGQIKMSTKSGLPQCTVCPLSTPQA